MITIKKMRIKDGRRPPRRFAPKPTISKTTCILTSGWYRNPLSSLVVLSRCKTHPSTWHAAQMQQPLGNANTAQTVSHECSRLLPHLYQAFNLRPPSAHWAFSLQLVQCQRVGWNTPAGTWPSQLATLNTTDETRRGQRRGIQGSRCKPVQLAL